MSRVYSTRFLDLSTAVYTVADGNLAVVRDIVVYATGPATFLVENPAAGVMAAGSLNSGEVFHWSGRQVVNAGESLVYNQTASYVMVSGYLLSA